MLRLAVVLHRSRSELAAPDIKMEVDKQRYRLVFPDSWLEQHPLTKADLDQEAKYVKMVGYQFEYQ